MADTKEQVIRLIYEASQAEAAARKFANAEQKRARDNAKALEKAAKDAAVAQAKAAKDAAAAQAKAAKAAAAAQAKAAKDTADAQKKAARDAATVQAKAAKDAAAAAVAAEKTRANLNNEVNQLLVRHAHEEAEAAKASARQKAAAEHEAHRQWESDFRARHNVAMTLWKWEQASAKESAKNIGNELAWIMKAQAGLGALRSLGSAIAGQFREAAEHVRKSAQEFAVLRKSMQEVATLKGGANTSAFTLEEAKKAAAFNLTPTEYRDFQAEFQNYAGSQIGGESGKLNEKQGEEYAGRVAELMKSSGVAPPIGAELAGSLLENSKGPQDVDSLMKRLSTTFTVLEKGRVPLSRALPQMSRIMGRGIDSVQAAQLFSIASPVAPGEEGTAVESALKAIEEMKTKGTGTQFGVTKGMGQFEAVRAFAENINQRKRALIAGGMSEQAADDELNVLLDKTEVVNDVRERRGLIAGFGRQGVELGGFERYGRIARETPSDFEAARIQRYEKSEQGRQDKIDVAQAVENAGLGARNQALLRRRQIAEVELTKAGRFEEVGAHQVATGILGTFGGADDRSVYINQQMLRRARAELGESSGIGDTTTALNNEATDAVMRGLLERIAVAVENKGRDAKPPGGEKQVLIAVPGNNNNPLRQ